MVKQHLRSVKFLHLKSTNLALVMTFALYINSDRLTLNRCSLFSVASHAFNPHVVLSLCATFNTILINLLCAERLTLLLKSLLRSYAVVWWRPRLELMRVTLSSKSTFRVR